MIDQPELRRRSFLTALPAAGLAAGIGAGPAIGQAQPAGEKYPSRPIRIVLGSSAGSSTDTISRLIGEQLTAAWGQPTIVDNRVGAGGTIGYDYVAKAPPDGYTVLVAITSLIQSIPLYPNLPYDVFRDLAPVTEIARSTSVLLVTSSLPAKTLAELVALAKASPGKYTYASFGAGTSPNLHGELLKLRAGIDITHVPYKGAAPAIAALLKGEVNAAFIDIGSARPHLASGQVRPLGVTGTKRFDFLPDVPTMGEQGYAGFEPYGWFGMFVPAKTPMEIVIRLSTETRRILREPAIVTRFKDMGLTPLGSTPEEFAAALRIDAPIWAEIVKKANMKLE